MGGQLERLYDSIVYDMILYCSIVYNTRVTVIICNYGITIYIMWDCHLNDGIMFVAVSQTINVGKAMS